MYKQYKYLILHQLTKEKMLSSITYKPLHLFYNPYLLFSSYIEFFNSNNIYYK
jgi:hypothetical protein